MIKEQKNLKITSRYPNLQKKTGNGTFTAFRAVKLARLKNFKDFKTTNPLVISVIFSDFAKAASRQKSNTLDEK